MEERGGMLVDGGAVGGQQDCVLVLSSSPFVFSFLCCLVHAEREMQISTY